LTHLLGVDCKPDSSVGTHKNKCVKTVHYRNTADDKELFVEYWDTPGLNDINKAAALEGQSATGAGMLYLVVISCAGNKVKPDGTDLA